MFNLSNEELNKMQERAILHAKDMQKRAQIKDNKSLKSTVKDKSETPAVQNKKIKSNEAISKNSKAVKADSANKFYNPSKLNIAYNSMDEEQMLLMTFILILIFDKADKILILALIYIMM